MSGILEMLGLGTPRFDSQGQLDEMKRNTYSSAAEQQARASGFRSADEMMAFLKQRDQNSQRQGSQMPSVSGLINHPMHPKNMLNYVLSALKGS